MAGKKASPIDNVVITTDDQGGLIGVSEVKDTAGTGFHLRNSIRVSKPMASILSIFRDEIMSLKKGRVDE